MLAFTSLIIIGSAVSLTLARACAAKGYCSRSVGRSVGRSVYLCVYLFPRFLSNRGCCRYQTWICGYVQRALGTVVPPSDRKSIEARTILFANGPRPSVYSLCNINNSLFFFSLHKCETVKGILTKSKDQLDRPSENIHTKRDLATQKKG